jgi:uncharacterized protein YecE (DUF72 family)
MSQMICSLELWGKDDDNCWVKLYVGTSGFSYKEWRGKFYPQDISPKEMLRYYSRTFNAVEINNTFYRMPNRDLLRRWSQEVPDNFIFALKAPRKITHFKRLKDVEEETGYLIATAAELGAKLGPILFQLPPTFPIDLRRMEKFLDILNGILAAFEFGHSSWLNPETLSLLSSKNFALCISDRELADTPDIVRTAKWGYLRLRRGDYSKSELAGWHNEIYRPEWETAYTFFKHESEGMGLNAAMIFLQIS